MTVYVHMKKLGKGLRHVTSCSYELERHPQTLRDLISIMVCHGVQAYNRRLKQAEPADPLTEDTLEAMSQVGKVAFGIHYAEREADCAQAITTALSGFTDGLFRFFINDVQITQLDAPLALRENDTITIIRLTMLTGGFL